MRLGFRPRRVPGAVVVILSIATAAHAATVVAPGDVQIVGNSATMPAVLVRGGPPVPLNVSIAANDGSIPSPLCDGLTNSATSAQNYQLGGGPTLSSSGSNVDAIFDCDRDFTLSPQVENLSLTLAAANDAPLGMSAVSLSVGPQAVGSPSIGLGAELSLIAGFTSPTLHVRVNPRAPSDLQASPGNGQIRLEWNASPDVDITSYVVTRGSGLFQTPIVVPASETTFTDSGLANGTTYCYSVRSRYVDGFGRRFQSPEIGPVCASPVPYVFAGFESPVMQSWTNAARGGQGIALKWALFEDTTPVIDTVVGDGHWNISSVQVSCETGDVITGAEPSAAAGASDLRYDELEGHYVFVWKTDKAWVGTCRRVSVAYGGQAISADFAFKF